MAFRLTPPSSDPVYAAPPPIDVQSNPFAAQTLPVPPLPFLGLPSVIAAQHLAAGGGPLPPLPAVPPTALPGMEAFLQHMTNAWRSVAAAVAQSGQNGQTEGEGEQSGSRKRDRSEGEEGDDEDDDGGFEQKEPGFDPRPHKCTLCDATFTRRDRLKVHLTSHTGEKPFKCDECGAAFGQRAHLRTHLRRHSGEKPYACDQCESAFVTFVELKGHKARRHAFGESIPTEGDHGDYVCTDCGSRWVSAYKLRVHRRMHTGENPYQCDLCGDSFSAKSALDLHREVHATNTQFVCDRCGSGFRNTHGLMRHINLGNYRCEMRKKMEEAGVVPPVSGIAAIAKAAAEAARVAAADEGYDMSPEAILLAEPLPLPAARVKPPPVPKKPTSPKAPVQPPTVLRGPGGTLRARVTYKKQGNDDFVTGYDPEYHALDE